MPPPVESTVVGIGVGDATQHGNAADNSALTSTAPAPPTSAMFSRGSTTMVSTIVLKACFENKLMMCIMKNRRGVSVLNPSDKASHVRGRHFLVYCRFAPRGGSAMPAMTAIIVGGCYIE